MALRRKVSRKEIVRDNKTNLKMSFFGRISHKISLWIKELKGEL